MKSPSAKWFRVTVRQTTLREYLVEAEDELEARTNWANGEIQVHDDVALGNTIVEVTEEID